MPYQLGSGDKRGMNSPTDTTKKKPARQSCTEGGDRGNCGRTSPASGRRHLGRKVGRAFRLGYAGSHHNFNPAQGNAHGNTTRAATAGRRAIACRRRTFAGQAGNARVRGSRTHRGDSARSPAVLESLAYSEIRSGAAFCSRQAGEPTGDRCRRDGLVERAVRRLRATRRDRQSALTRNSSTQTPVISISGRLRRGVHRGVVRGRCGHIWCSLSADQLGPDLVPVSRPAVPPTNYPGAVMLDEYALCRSQSLDGRVQAVAHMPKRRAARGSECLASIVVRQQLQVGLQDFHDARIHQMVSFYANTIRCSYRVAMSAWEN